MKSYFANTFSAKGLLSAIPDWDESYHVVTVYGMPESAVNIFIDDLLHDLQVHDIPVQAYLSCIYPDTPDILIIPSLKQVILNSNYLFSLLKTISNKMMTQQLSIEKLNITQLCSKDMVAQYQKTIIELEEKIKFYQQEGYNFLTQLNLLRPSPGVVTNEMLLLLQSIFPVSAENTGEPEKVLTISITSSGWLSELQKITATIKRRYILNGSNSFLQTFFKLAESRAQNLKMKCDLIISPLYPDQIIGILFPDEHQAILAKNDRHGLIPNQNDVTLNFNHDKKEDGAKLKEFEQKLTLGANSFIKAHTYRKELDEYYWHTLDLDQLFTQRRRVMHQLLAHCDGQELWQYFL
ncbi:MAG: hypothetical protein KAX49_06660 [Halanaerobiales bacterium]|nr:hypothetical protein [Halanaerobiales bacterium]